MFQIAEMGIFEGGKHNKLEAAMEANFWTAFTYLAKVIDYANV